MVPTHWCLSPAVCYHAYAGLEGQTLDPGVMVTARGHCFRNEDPDALAPGRRQVEFQMREIVLVGGSAWIEEWLRELQPGVEALARAQGLDGAWCPPRTIHSFCRGRVVRRTCNGSSEPRSSGACPMAWRWPASIATVRSLANGFKFAMPVERLRTPPASPSAWIAGRQTTRHIMNTEEVSARIGLCLPRLAPRLRPTSATLSDLTLDSLDTVELLCVIHEEFGVRLKDSEFHPKQTVDGMLSAIAERSTQS